MDNMPQKGKKDLSFALSHGAWRGGERKRTRLPFFLAVLLLAAATVAQAYPLDGYSQTGIRRLLRLERLKEANDLWTLEKGAQLVSKDIRLRLTGGKENLELPPRPAAKLQQKLEALLADKAGGYAVGLLDITAGRPIRYAAVQEERLFSPGSVGKLAVAAGLFTELARLFPDDPSKRQALLHSRMVTAGAWIHRDEHDVPFYDPQSDSASMRPIREGDVFSLYEWTDHMLSPSANAAASTVWKEVMLMRHFGATYPPSATEEKAFFAHTPRQHLTDLSMKVVNEPLREMGIAAGDWQLGSFFTATGKRIVPPGGNSWANVRGFLRFLIVLEKGRLVDEWSSLELKKLLYLTIHRIRYAASPALADAAVYFKSGSLYKCAPERGFRCGKYRGNVYNYMNSVAIVEHPDGRNYLVVVLSNVLRRNAAIEHQELATAIDALIAPPGAVDP